jgi:aspartyl-tRNA(Asn)/glutamyl-tRNA(Gln) amidotransferase subunit B
MKYKPTIGLEIHVELKTKTKMFCDSLNDPDEKKPNTNVCPVCMGHPGTLPVINKEAVKKVLMVGKALNGKLAKHSQFDRKNYFYPDIPKGYQISQYKYPLVEGGWLEIRSTKHDLPDGKAGIRNNIEIQNSNSKTKKIEITRIHLEEDTGGSQHLGGHSLVDYNRAGIPLMELVTEPCIESGEDARKFAEELRLVLRYLGVSDADMEKGQMRIEANISIAKINILKEGATKPDVEEDRKPQIDLELLGTKVEIKNLNSFRAVERAINYEIKRQEEVLEKKEKVIQETRGWDENKGETFSQRVKEDSHDYRYFPEPDLPSLLITDDWLLNTQLPELPQQKRDRLKREYEIKSEAIEIFINDREFADYFEQVASEIADQSKGKSGSSKEFLQLAVNYLTSDLQSLIKEKNVEFKDIKITPENFAELVLMAGNKEITSRVAKDVLRIMSEKGEDPSQIVEREGLKQNNDESSIHDVVDKIIKDNPSEIEKYKKGKESVMQFLVGQGMKETKGSVNPAILTKVLKEKLKK